MCIRDSALAEGRPIHIAHVNAYCRGQITGDPLLEASRALKALAEAPAARSESYLSLWNGTSARVVDSAPRSHVTRTCLLTGGYPPTAAGMEEAILAGWARVHGTLEGKIELLPPALGLESYRMRDSSVYVSFPVNSPGAAIALAIAKSGDSFSINALSTDGGGIPRNTTLEQGLALVRFGALSMKDLVRKASLNPAQMLGLPEKGRLSPGADADVVVVDPDTHAVSWAVVEGQIVVRDGSVVGRGGRLVTSKRGVAALTEKEMPSRVVVPDWMR